MIRKVTNKLNELATNEALTHNEEMGKHVEKNKHLLSTLQGIVNSLESNNAKMGETVKQQNTGLVSSKVVQESCANLHLANLEVLEANDACSSTNKRKFTELQEKENRLLQTGTRGTKLHWLPKQVKLRRALRKAWKRCWVRSLKTHS